MDTALAEILDDIIDKIKEEKCILIIGPDITLSDTDKTINEQLKDYLESTFRSKIKNYYTDDEFFSFYKESDEGYAIGKIRKFYESLQPKDIHLKIASIPFHLIISVSPDHVLRNIFEHNKYDHTFKFYNKEQNHPDDTIVTKPGMNKPLLYNLFGDIDADGSMVFTYDNLFEYLESVFGKYDLPQLLKTELQQEYNTVLFIGFRFEKWYFKLLLRLLNLHKVKIKNASNQYRNSLPLVRSFYIDEFKIDFIDNDESAIINSIYEKCKELGITRAAKEAPAAKKPEIFISYAWEGESEATVNSLFEALTGKGYNIIRDKVDLGYKGNIREFMQSIGKGKYIIPVISDKYLTSSNCMYEMLQIVENGDAYKRIFPIVLSDAKIYTINERIDYTNYWDAQIKETNAKIKSIDVLTDIRELSKVLDDYADIRRIIVSITDTLANMNTLTPAMHKGSDFSILMQALDQQMKEDTLK